MFGTLVTRRIAGRGRTRIGSATVSFGGEDGAFVGPCPVSPREAPSRPDHSAVRSLNASATKGGADVARISGSLTPSRPGQTAAQQMLGRSRRPRRMVPPVVEGSWSGRRTFLECRSFGSERGPTAGAPNRGAIHTPEK